VGERRDSKTSTHIREGIPKNGVKGLLETTAAQSAATTAVALNTERPLH
jgi:hypothetical protein